MLDRFKRRKKTMADKQPNKTTSGSNIEPTEVVDLSQVTDLDVIVSRVMGLSYPKPFSTDRSLVNEMVQFARERGIKLPKFTSDPTKIATAISVYKAEENN